MTKERSNRIYNRMVTLNNGIPSNISTFAQGRDVDQRSDCLSDISIPNTGLNVKNTICTAGHNYVGGGSYITQTTAGNKYLGDQIYLTVAGGSGYNLDTLPNAYYTDNN